MYLLIFYSPILFVYVNIYINFFFILACKHKIDLILVEEFNFFCFYIYSEYILHIPRVKNSNDIDKLPADVKRDTNIRVTKQSLLYCWKDDGYSF